MNYYSIEEFVREELSVLCGINMNKKELMLMHSYLFDDLRWFDEICKEHSIEYSLAYGSLLGAVRHEGFIPWDDDLDIIMTRENYEKMFKYSFDFKDQYRELKNYKTDNELHIIYGHLSDNRVLVYPKNIPDKKRKLHIDISVCDYIQDSPKWRMKIRNILTLYFTRLFAYRKGHFATSGRDRFIKTAVLKVGAAIYSKCSDSDLEKIILRVSGSTKKSGLMAPIASPYGFLQEIFPSEYYEKTILHKFENIMIPVFEHYDEILRKRYGEYQTLPPEKERYLGVEQVMIELVEGIDA